MHFILTVATSQFIPKTVGNAFGISLIAVGHASERFFDTNIFTHFVKFKIPGKHYVILLHLKSDSTHGQFGSTLWSDRCEKTRPSRNKATTLILIVRNFKIPFILETAAVFSY